MEDASAAKQEHFLCLCWDSSEFSSVAAAVVCSHQQLESSLPRHFVKHLIK